MNYDLEAQEGNKVEHFIYLIFGCISSELWGLPYRLQHMLVQFRSSGKNTVKPIL
jgi:hypothetical protein